MQTELDRETLEQMRDTELKTVDPDTLADISAVEIDPSLPREERMKAYLAQIKNPYCFRYGKLVVKLSFAQDGPTLEQRLTDYLRSQ